MHIKKVELKRSEVTDDEIGTSSVEAISRDFHFIKTFDGIGGDVDLYIHKPSYRDELILFRAYAKNVKNGRRNLLFFLSFKYKVEMQYDTGQIGTKRVYQVDLVETSASVESLGLATYVYKYLTIQNMTIVSDNTQYRGGQAIWKKLLNDPACVVRVMDNSKSEFLKDLDGSEIYDGNNIPADMIWSADENSDVSKNILLILNHK